MIPLQPSSAGSESCSCTSSAACTMGGECELETNMLAEEASDRVSGVWPERAVTRTGSSGLRD